MLDRLETWTDHRGIDWFVVGKFKMRLITQGDSRRATNPALYGLLAYVILKYRDDPEDLSFADERIDFDLYPDGTLKAEGALSVDVPPLVMCAVYALLGTVKG